MHLKTPIVLQGYIEEKWIKGRRVDFFSRLQKTGSPSQTRKMEPNNIVDSFVLDPKELLRCVSRVQNRRTDQWYDKVIALFPCFKRA